MNFSHSETSTTIISLQNHPHSLPSERLNTVWNAQCQGSATAQFPILAKKELRPHAGSSFYVLSYRAPRGKWNTRLFAT